jgi:5-methylcytosine-specific restriction endonuclease McrA
MTSIKNRADYNAYIQSPAWRKKRAARIRRDHYMCQTCGVRGYLTVHHRTYERLGRERMDDLITLCESCHDAVTRTISSRQIDQGWPGVYGSLRLKLSK